MGYEHNEILSYEQAIKLCKEGEKVRCKTWKPEVFIYKDEIWILSDDNIRTPVIFQLYAPGCIVPYTAGQLDYFAEWVKV